MTASDYARFLELQGYRVRRTAGVYWFNVNRRFYLAAPHHREYELTAQDLKPLFSGWDCFGVRYAAPSTHTAGALSYQIVCDHRDYSLELLSANIRSKVRRGLKRCEVGPAELRLLETEGQLAHRETLKRQRREDAWSEEQWRRFWQAAGQVPGVEGWGAWVGGRLVGFLVTVTFDDAVEFLLARSCSDERNAYPNNALIYSVAEEMLVRRGAPQITFGLESLEPLKPLDEFKFSMGFRPKPVRQVVIFHPVLRALLANRHARTILLRWLEQRGEKGVYWRKAAGLLRFAEETSGEMRPGT